MELLEFEIILKGFNFYNFLLIIRLGFLEQFRYVWYKNSLPDVLIVILFHLMEFGVEAHVSLRRICIEIGNEFEFNG